jgi:hypothetical protein
MKNIHRTIEIQGQPLIKFQSKDRILSLQKGHLYAKTLGYYRQLEQETGDADVGDEFEAMIHVNDGYIVFPGTRKIINLDDALLKTSHSDDYVFCMFTAEKTNMQFSFTDEQKEKMLSFGDTALIIKDGNEFIRRVKIAAEKAGYQLYVGKVTYYDPSIDGDKFWGSMINGIWNVCLCKRKRYEYQQEFRFIFVKDKEHNIEDHIQLEVGDLTDITEVITAEQALNGIMHV